MYLVFRLRPSDFFLSSCTSIDTSLARTNGVPRRPDFRWIRLKIYTGRGSTEMLELARRFFLLLGVCYASLSCSVFTTVRIIVIISQNRRIFLVFPWRPVVRYEFRRCTENRRQDRNYQLRSPQNPKFFSDWTMINKNVSVASLWKVSTTWWIYYDAGVRNSRRFVNGEIIRKFEILCGYVITKIDR